MQPKSSPGRPPAPAPDSSATEKRAKQTRGEIENRSPGAAAAASASETSGEPSGARQPARRQERWRSFESAARADHKIGDDVHVVDESPASRPHHQRAATVSEASGEPPPPPPPLQQQQVSAGPPHRGRREAEPAEAAPEANRAARGRPAQPAQGGADERISESLAASAKGLSAQPGPQQISCAPAGQWARPQPCRQQEQQQQRPARTTSAEERPRAGNEALRPPEQKLVAATRFASPSRSPDRIAAQRERTAANNPPSHPTNNNSRKQPPPSRNRIQRQSSAPANERPARPTADTCTPPTGRQQRIKVTLSRPRTESAEEPPNEPQKPAGPQRRERPRQCSPGSQPSDSSSLVNFAFGQPARARGQSTATLISGSIEQIAAAPAADQQAEVGPRGPAAAAAVTPSERPSDPVGSDNPAGQPAGAPARLSRSEQENQLRRIASERHRTRPSRATNEADNAKITPASGAAAAPVGAEPRRAASRAAESGASSRSPLTLEAAERKNFLLSTPVSSLRQEPPGLPADKTTTTTTPTPAINGLSPTKQLAIYINGKIRSNSIFCSRSVSSTSFAGALKGSGEPKPSAANNQTGPPASLSARTPAGIAQQPQRQGPDAWPQPPGEAGAGERSNRRHFVSGLVPRVCGQSKRPGLRLVRLGGRAGGLGRAWDWLRYLRRWPFQADCCRRSAGADQRGLKVLEGGPTDEPYGAEPAEPEPELRTYKLNPSSMFLRKAMRYYRLWIYSANSIILLGTVIFVLSALYVTSDHRFQLVVSPGARAARATAGSANATTAADTPSTPAPGWPPEMERLSFSIGLGEPVMLLAYLMIAVQLGVLQAIGCFGAIRMKERLIQAFWYLILALILVDVMVLVYWLQRYDVILKSLRYEMTTRLSQQYGHGSATEGAERPMETDKTFTRILDEIQAGSRCCGISSSSDYRRSEWRRTKILQLRAQLRKLERADAGAGDGEADPGLEQLLARLALVPASCCRRQHEESARPAASGDADNWLVRQRAPDDDLSAGGGPDEDRPGRVNGADDKDGQGRGPMAYERGPAADGDRRPTLADVIDRRWSGLSLGLRASAAGPNDEDPSAGAADSGDDEEDDGSPARPYSNKRARLMTKQMHYDSSEAAGAHSGQERAQRRARWTSAAERGAHWPAGDDAAASHAPGGDNDDDKEAAAAGQPGESISPAGDGWAVESKLDQRGRVLSRLIQIIEAGGAPERRSAAQGDSLPTNSSGEPEELAGHARRWSAQLDRLRQLLFADRRHGAGFIWPNELGLNYGQFRMLESYLAGRIKAERPRTRLRRRSLAAGHDSGREAAASAGAQQAADPRATRRLALIRELVAADGELSCPARSHYDEAHIYTRGCQPHIKAWLQGSANILFITGFCVLTVLKFCSLILLRLEIREMIHKIRVLRGMATEYNALQDLEPYLPRSSVCAQAAELTPTGVSPALGGATGLGSPTGCAAAPGMAPGAGQAVATCGSPTGGAPLIPAPRRLGGSFSEAVAAAAAVAHQQRMAEQQQQQLQRHLRDYERTASLVNCARAASTRTIVGATGCGCVANLSGGPILGAAHGIPGSLCPCTTSMSMAAHLNHSASQLTALGQQQQRHPAGFRSDLFPAGLAASMPRRHTAISVCPAAAAAAAAAAHHLMMRRGTFAIANPAPFGSCSGNHQSHQQPQQQYQSSGGGLSVAGAGGPRHSSSSMLQAKSLNYLNQHRHSAHAVPPSHLLFRSSGGNANLLMPTAGKLAQPFRRPSSLFAPADELGLCAPGANSRRKQSSNQLDPAGAHTDQPTFRRQVSGGAQSAVNFSLDIAPVQFTESRRSIH